VRFELIAFDLDGTLLDTLADIGAATNAMRAHWELAPLAREVVRGFVGDGVRRLVERALGTETPGEVERGLALFRDHYGEHLLDQTRPYAGVPELLTTLQRAGVRLAIVTNKPAEMARPSVEALGLRPFFEVVLCPEDVERKKPAPDPFRKLVVELGVPPERALAVGDHPNDLVAGRAAGLGTCAVTWGYNSEECLQALEPDFIARRPREIVAIVG
jgi:phosphoglycolate phosphatase